MKYSFCLIWVLLLVITGANASGQKLPERAPELGRAVAESPDDFTAVVKRARQLEVISYRVGWTLDAGEFHELTQECLRYGSIQNFKTLLRDEDSIIRVLGLICLARSVDTAAFNAIATPLFKDESKVQLTNGCVINRALTVGSIAKQLAEGHFFHAADLAAPVR